jgi:Bacterial SH3 domain
VSAPDNDLPLFCELGWHRPEPVARWNCGYYFTRCTRCRHDLVRTTYGRWHVPYGHRVVWQARPPANAVSAQLVRDPAASRAANGTELPIQEVLRHLQNGDRAAGMLVDDPAAAGVECSADRASEADEPVDGNSALTNQAASIPRPVRAARIADFMEEATGASAWEAPTRAYLVRPVRADRGQDRDVETQEDPGPGPFGRLKARLSGAFERDRSEGERRARPRESQNMRIALVAIAPILLVLLALMLWAGREEHRPVAADEGGRGSALIGPGQPSFVTASVLNCRSAPAREGEPVQVLMRGDPVQLLARDGEWVSLVHEGGQCWAQVRYFSVERPI